MADRIAVQDGTLYVVQTYHGRVRGTCAAHQVYRVSADDKYVNVWAGSRMLRNLTLRILDFIDMPHLIQTHRAHLVDPAKIRKVDDDCVIMHNGARVPMSRRYRPSIHRLWRVATQDDIEQSALLQLHALVETLGVDRIRQALGDK